MISVGSKSQPSAESDANLYDSLKHFLILLQVGGILPQRGLGNSCDDVNFSWKSPNVFFSSFIILSLILTILISLKTAFDDTYSDLADYVNLFSYIICLMTLILYLHLAPSFAKFLKEWCKTDNIMNEHYGYPENLKSGMNLITGFVVAMWICELFLVFEMGDGTGAKFSNFKAQFLNFTNNARLNLVVKYFVMFAALWSSLILLLNDLFIILLSIPIAMRFRQINLDAFKHREIRAVSYWETVRINYSDMARLCKSVDQKISHLILLSFMANFIFMLIQLYYSLRTSETFSKIYFLYSFFHVVGRLVSVSLYAARINDESRQLALTLNSSHSTPRNVEVKRLLQQISLDDVAFTGKRFFKLTRGLVLNMCSAVVTFELILVQLSDAVNQIKA